MRFILVMVFYQKIFNLQDDVKKKELFLSVLNLSILICLVIK